LLTNTFTIALALSVDNFILASKSPTLSVCPTIKYFFSGLAFKNLAMFFKAAVDWIYRRYCATHTGVIVPV